MACCKIIKRTMIEDAGNGIADRTHHMLDRAFGFIRIGAIPAFLIRGFTHAADGGKWAIQYTDHLTDGDLPGWLDEGIAAFETPSTGQQSCPFQCQKDLL